VEYDRVCFRLVAGFFGRVTPHMTHIHQLRFGIVLLFVFFPRIAAAEKDDALPASKALEALFDSEWEWTLREDPLFATHLGDPRYNDRWPDVTLETFERRHAHRQDVLKQLAAIDPAKLSANDRLNYRLFRRQFELDVEEFPFHWHLIPLNQREGIQDAGSLADVLRLATLKDYSDWLIRLDTFPKYLDDTIILMREGIRQKMLLPRIVMERVPHQIARQIVDNPQQSLFFKPFKKFPEEIPEGERELLIAAGRRAISGKIVPAYRRFAEFFEKEYLPACLPEVGAWQLPRGKELYEFRARQFTTTDLTPQEIHEIGQREVRRIRAEMEAIVRQVGFQGTFKQFLDHLRADPQFYFKDPNELLAAYLVVCKKIDPQLPRLFRKLPRIPYGIEPIPEHIAPDTTTAYYRQPSADGSRAGTFFVNLYRPEVRPKYEMEALSLHEAVPGHHLQIALATELEGLPTFRRFTSFTAYVEGWALYAERLGSDLGLYRDPYSKFGQLTYEMWRAVRLVVDTGMHSMHWARQQAIEFFADNTAKTEVDIVNEVDRYIAWPGQALAYKIGELKIRELRGRAEKELGDKFDIREFHDVILRHGAVPLDVLEELVLAWLADRK
jgi:prolyl oligopeptidase